jgi:sugar phosphate isomerase/epimerase
MKLTFLATYWGSEGCPPDTFIARAVQAGYHGMEVYMPPGDTAFAAALCSAVAAQKQKDPSFLWVLQHITPYRGDGVNAFMQQDIQQLSTVLACKPDRVNAHTGKDFFSFEDNCRIIAACEHLAQEAGIPLLHETHRGRFAFQAATLPKFLRQFPGLQLTADFSHFCVVSESMLADQEDSIAEIIPHVMHVHARVGFEEAPQVNNPFAPEWEHHLARFMDWWQQITTRHAAAGNPYLTITPEFGPAPYMPAEPFTQKPLCDQWQVNLDMKACLLQHLKTT